MRSSHFVLTLGRSGSNTLVDMLNQNPALLNFGEVLGSWTRLRKVQRRLRLLKINDADYLDWILGSRSFLSAANAFRTLGKIKDRRWSEIKSLRKIESVGVKDFSVNLVGGELSQFLLTRPRIKVIGLLRQNVIDRMVSNETLEATGLVKVRNYESPLNRQKVYIPPESVLRKLERIDAENIELAGMLDVLPQERVFRVYYDRLFASAARAEEIVREIYTFLGVGDCRPRVRMRKILELDPLLAVLNAEEVRGIIAESRFGQQLGR